MKGRDEREREERERLDREWRGTVEREGRENLREKKKKIGPSVF